MADIRFNCSRIDDLSARALHEIIAHRERVFIVEQNCPYQDADDYDAVSWHVVCYSDDNLAAYLRIVDAGYKYAEPSIGRVLTAKPYRGLGLGKVLMSEAMSRINSLYPNQNNRISAQAYLLDFYQGFGFEVCGGEYLEDDIPHIEMLKVYQAAI